MQVLSAKEIEMVGGAAVDAHGNFDFWGTVGGGIWGAVDGFMTGMMIGGKFGGAGGFGFGAISQLVGWIGSAIVGGVGFGILGAMNGQSTAASALATYRSSAMGDVTRT